MSRRWKRFVFLGSLLSGLGVSQANAQFPELPLPNRTQQVNATPFSTSPLASSQKSNVRLQVYNVPSQWVGAVGAELQVIYHDNAQVSITTDPKTGQLMIMAPDAIHKSIGTELSEFMRQNKIPQGDRGMNVASSRQHVYTLKNLSWREMEESIRRLGGPKLQETNERNGELTVMQLANSSGMRDILQIDRRLNTVTLLGSGASVNGWTQVIYSLDHGQVDPQTSTHVVPLAPAEPRRVRSAIQLVKTTTQEQAQAEVNVGGDEQATAIGSIDSLSAESGLFGDVQIEFIEEIDLVIIRGSKRDVQRTLDVIEKIKKQAEETQPKVDVFKLTHANAEAVSALVTDLYESIYAPRQGSVSITPLGQPNALLLIGREEVVESVKALVAKIDQPLAPDDQLKVIRLLHASSVDLESRVREFFVQKPGSNDDDRIGVATRVKVLADYRTNSLIVQAAPREMLEVEKLLRELDVPGTEAQSEVKVFRLSNTLSDDLRDVIEEVLIGAGAGGDESQAAPPSGRITITERDGGGTVESDILAGVVVTSDPSVNALVVRAPAQSMELIGRLIQELDSLPSAEARIKVFEVQNGDAQSLAATLQQLFGLQVTAGQSTTGGLFGLGAGQQAALTTGGEGSLVPLRISVDTRTNSVIASGSQSDLEVIEVLLLRLDEDGVETRRTEVVWLRNAEAADVNTALNDFLNVQRQAVNQILFQGGYISTFEQVDREVFVVAEPTTNSLVVSATPRYFETIMGIIDRLDRRPPLVAVQVLVAEVQLDDSLELGAEWGIQDGLLFDRGAATGGTLSSPVFNLGNTLANGSTTAATATVGSQAISSFGLGRAGAAGVGGLVLSASSEAIGVLIRALQTAERIQVLSRPMITTLDNREASTLVGAQVPRIQGVTNGGQGVGQTINAVDVPVGLGIAVLPRVNQDGLIIMRVQVQNSAVGEPNTGIPIGFGPNGETILSPIITSTEASTTVSAYSGQTVVFAGLISKSRNSVSRRIPILGSLPLIGGAFRFDTETEQRRELLVVLTPRIIQSDEDYETLKHIESSRMSWCLADVLNVHGDVGLSGGNGLWGPARSSTIYPDLQPTVIEDRSTPRSGAPFGTPMIIGEYSSENALENIPVVPEIDSNAGSPPESPFKRAAFSQPVGVQQGNYR